MTTKVVTDEMLGNFARRQNDLFTRVAKGSVDFDTAMDGLQLLQENNSVVAIVRDYSAIIAEWDQFYGNLFDKNYDLSSIQIPKKPKGKWSLLVITDINLETIYAKCKELFPVWRWTNEDFDKIVTENERDAKKNGAYAIWVKDVVGADENLRNLSANDIKHQDIATETFAERLIHELKFFKETGSHLDVNNVTLCSGSRYRDGRVPYVSWNGGKMSVNWCDADNSHDSLRSRQAVS